MVMAFGASCTFLTPIGHKNNIIIMGPGGYRFRDFVRVGLPLTVLLFLAALVLLPVFWPLQ